MQQIRVLAKEQDAIILAHYYQPYEIQQIADVVGDSFELARKAKEAKESTIVLCGVRFMAEGAKILNPTKRVLLPSLEAGCPLADMVTPADILALKKTYPQAAVVCYINSTAAVKAVSDVCCTSSSAVRIVKALPFPDVIFVPDQNLGAYVQSQVPEKRIILHAGHCPVHHQVTLEDIQTAQAQYPRAPVLMHPECRQEVQAKADFLGSTAAIMDYVAAGAEDTYLIATEQEIEVRLKQSYPEKTFYTVSKSLHCPDMKKISLTDVIQALTQGIYEVHLEESVRKAAENSLLRMIEMQNSNSTKHS